jgi:hypothetical protein
MPRVLVTDDNGTMALDERVTAADFETEHFRCQLSDRLAWAVADAVADQPPDSDPRAWSDRGSAGSERERVPAGAAP